MFALDVSELFGPNSDLHIYSVLSSSPWKLQLYKSVTRMQSLLCLAFWHVVRESHLGADTRSVQCLIMERMAGGCGNTGCVRSLGGCAGRTKPHAAHSIHFLRPGLELS